jgi:hypothetical protein
VTQHFSNASIIDTTMSGISRAMMLRDVPEVLEANRSETMKKQIATIMLGAVVMLGTATSLLAQTSGLAVGGGAAGGANGTYKDPYGFNGNNAYKAMVIQRKQH